VILGKYINGNLASGNVSVRSVSVERVKGLRLIGAGERENVTVKA
jgi:hypothetical protein